MRAARSHDHLKRCMHENQLRRMVFQGFPLNTEMRRLSRATIFKLPPPRCAVWCGRHDIPLQSGSDRVWQMTRRKRNATDKLRRSALL